MADRFDEHAEKIREMIINGNWSKVVIAAYLRAEFWKEDDINPSLCLSCENKIYFADPDGSVEVCTGYKPEPPKESKQNE